ncbi:MAG TPA: methylated-DNA--[protein]-cysteine S-methyltransferase [Anaerovoracaceae bacterium]|nr:methylated-DNA--[protein]-cysteine S-methyltransferase [Anaerovoracaceae bacterium]
MKNVYYYETKIGLIGIAEKEDAITDIFFGEDDAPKDSGEMIMNETELIKTAAGQIDEFLNGTLKDFDLPLCTEGTEFQKSAWEALCTIPYGEVRSYKQMAEQVGNPKACRAIGMANNRNPIAIVIPCHRVIGSNGKLVGYGGGLHIKKQLLELEKRVLENGR